MEIQDAEVDWKKELGNDPQLILYVDEVLNYTDLEFEGSREQGFWYGEDDDTGYVEFFAWSGGEQDGFGGRHYEIETVDGEEVTLKGPWSSRAGIANNLGYGPCVKTLYRTHPDQLGGRSGHLTLERAEEVVDDYVEDNVLFERVEKFDNNEPYYIPTRGGER